MSAFTPESRHACLLPKADMRGRQLHVRQVP
jgi:hypothetical protein